MAGVLDAYKRVISPDGRAVQGRSPEDLANLARNGLLPFNDAIALKQMADETRAKAQAMQAQAMQAQQTPQPQPTVVDGYINELRARIAGGANQPARMGGIADLPAPNIGTTAMASGGIVAFAGEGPSLVTAKDARDYSSLSTEELNQLSKSKDREVSRAATQALLKRTGYMSPAEIVRHNYEQAKKDIKSGAAFPLIYDPRPLPSHMYDESGKPRVRSESPMLAPISAPAAAAAAPAAAPSAGGTASTVAPPGSPFDIAGNMMPQPSPFGGAQGMREFSAPAMSEAELRELLRTDPYVAGGGGGAGIASLARNAYRPATDALAAQLKDIQGRKYDTAADYEKAGIGAASKAQEERIQKDLAKMPEDKRFAALMALAKTGFLTAAAASAPGAGALEALAKGAIGGIEDHTAGRKELREREERLGDKQSALVEKREELRRAALDQDAALRRGDQKSAQEIAVKIAELQSDARKLEIQMRDSAATRQTMLARDQDAEREMTRQYYIAEMSGKTALAERILEAMAKRRNVDASIIRAQLEAQSREQVAQMRNQNMFGQFGGLGGGLNQAVADELARRQGQ